MCNEVNGIDRPGKVPQIHAGAQGGGHRPAQESLAVDGLGQHKAWQARRVGKGARHG